MPGSFGGSLGDAPPKYRMVYTHLRDSCAVLYRSSEATASSTSSHSSSNTTAPLLHRISSSRLQLDHDISLHVLIYIARVLCLHEVPKMIISDSGSQFVARF
jgi:hypothetical protein